MKNLIYQYWDGELYVGVTAGSEVMKEYANRIGADYLFEHNPRFVTNLGNYSPHYGSFKPIYDESFHKYDNVLFTDTDVFPVDNCQENIFENFNADIGICIEPLQPVARANKPPGAKGATKESDEKWASLIKNTWHVDMPRTDAKLLKVYNSGVVLYSRNGLLKARKNFVPFKKYVNLIKNNGFVAFYTSDQYYLHAMLKVAKMNYIELDNKWNSFVHYVRDKGNAKVNGQAINDSRTQNTNFVHIQLRSADHFTKEKLLRVTNLSVDKWNI